VKRSLHGTKGLVYKISINHFPAVDLNGVVKNEDDYYDLSMIVNTVDLH